jgi:membrane protein YdbS with pleckstrin-like domain
LPSPPLDSAIAAPPSGPAAISYNQGLTPLDPAHKAYVRVQCALFVAIPLVAAMVGEVILYRQNLLFPGIIAVPVALLAAMVIAQLPMRSFRCWGYDLNAEHLRVLRGFLWRTDTIVPLIRIQHIDVAQDPLQRLFGLASLIVHTAGTHNSIVTLPGLASRDAEAMRDRIKAQIKAEAL